ncbi:MAG: hypothetical protein ABSA77_02575 [Thermoguttaceae bacterium]|jgi:hypothetical protein
MPVLLFKVLKSRQAAQTPQPFHPLQGFRYKRYVNAAYEVGGAGVSISKQ